MTVNDTRTSSEVLFVYIIEIRQNDFRFLAI